MIICCLQKKIDKRHAVLRNDKIIKEPNEKSILIKRVVRYFFYGMTLKHLPSLTLTIGLVVLKYHNCLCDNKGACKQNKK